MIQQSPHCDSTRLKKLLDEVLSEPDERAALEHLDTCASCQMELELAACETTWWRELQECLAVGGSSQPASADAVADADFGATRAPEAAYSFLAPSDDPRMLGRIGLYEIAGMIGRGSTGIVFKACEPSLNRYVAIKVLSPELAHSSAARKRFAREARAAAAVTHEHIVPIYTVSEFQGLPYIAMQYIPGHSLQQRIDRSGPLGVVEAVRIALQTARALAAAHQQGLVHRDIKPGNILLTAGVENALVTDFGLARVADDASLTHSGLICGTPQYMSPEQARGETAGAQSDLFSLGSVIYAMCTGHSPFRAETMFGVIRRVCDAPQRPMREVNPEVPEWLQQLTDRLLSKAPEKRFGGAEEVAELLEWELAHLQNPASIRPPQRLWMTENGRRPRRRWSLLAVCAGAILLATVAGIIAVSAIRPHAAKHVDAAATHTWGNTTIFYDHQNAAIEENSPSRFVLSARTQDGTQHQLIINKDEDSGNCSLAVRQHSSSDGREAEESRELVDNSRIDDVFVDTKGGAFCVNAYGARQPSSQSGSNSSASASSSNSDGKQSKSFTRKRFKIWSSGVTEFSVGYVYTPWKNSGGRHRTVLYQSHDKQHTRLVFDRGKNLCTLAIGEADGEPTHKIALTPGGTLVVNGTNYDIDGAVVSVTEDRKSIEVKVDDKPLVSLRGEKS